MLRRTTLVVLLTQPLMTFDAVGVEAPTAPDMLRTSAPAISRVAGFRTRRIELGNDDIYVLSCVDPPRNSRADEEVLSGHGAVARCMPATGRMGHERQYVRVRSRRPEPGPSAAGPSALARPGRPSRTGPAPRSRDVGRGDVVARARFGCGDHLGPVDQDEVVAADDPAVREGARRNVSHRDEAWVGGIDEAGKIGLAEDVDLACDRMPRGEHHELAGLTRLDVVPECRLDEPDSRARLRVLRLLLSDVRDLVLVDH